MVGGMQCLVDVIKNDGMFQKIFFFSNFANQILLIKIVKIDNLTEKGCMSGKVFTMVNTQGSVLLVLHMQLTENNKLLIKIGN